MSTVNSANTAAKKGMTPLNKVLAIIAVAMAAITAIFGALAGLRFYQARQMNTEAERVTAQATSIRVSSWCAKVTPDSIPRIDEIYGEYRAFEQEMRDAVDAECPGRVNAAYMMSTYRAADMFTASIECKTIKDNTAVSCTGTVTTKTEKVPSLANYSNTTVKLSLDVGTSQSFILPQHSTPDVVTVTVPPSGSTTVEFETSYDSAWGDFYKVPVTSFFPND